MASSIRSNRLRLWFKIGFAAALVLTFGMGSASAGPADPATLQTGGTTNNGSDPTLIPNDGFFTVYQGTNSATNLIFDNTGGNGFLLILALPEVNNGTNSNFFNSTNPITSVTGGTGQLGGPSSSSTPPLYTSGTDGNSGDGNSGKWGLTTGYAGTMTSGDAFTTIFGKTNLDNSDSFVNFQTNDLSNNKINATGFDLYVFEISAPLAGKDTVSIQFNTDPNNGATIPVGTYAIAYGQDNGDTPYATKFTITALTTGGGGGTPGGGATPAPPSVVLLGFGGLGLAFVLARSRRRLAAA